MRSTSLLLSAAGIVVVVVVVVAERACLVDRETHSRSIHGGREERTRRSALRCSYAEPDRDCST